MMNNKFRGGLLGLKDFKMILSTREWYFITKMSVPVTAEEKTNKKNDVKARSLLLMALPNEHQLTFIQYTNAKTMFAAIKTQFGGSRRFLPPEWNTHVVVWMNKAETETMSIDDFTSSTNDVNTAIPAYEVSTASPNVNAASHQQDLEQIHKDDPEAMDLKWQLSLLSMRVKRECRAPRNKEGQFRNQDNTRKQGNNKETSSKVMLAIDGVGFDWSDIAEEQVQTNMALMAFSDSEVYTDKTCSKTCLKNYETLKKWCDDLIVKLNQTEFTAATYKSGLAIVEEQIITYRKNEVLFSEEVAVLKREVACKDYEINVLKSEFKKVKQEKKGIEFKIKKTDKASKDLDKLLGNDSKKNSDESLVKEQVSKNTSSFVESSLKVDKEIVFPIDKKVEFVKPKNHENPVKKSVRYAEMYRSQTPRGNQRNFNGQNSNQLGRDFVMYNKACFIYGSFDHVQINCDHHQRKRVVSRNNYNRVDYDYYAKTTHPIVHRNMTPRAVLLKTGLKPLNTVRPVNTAHPKPAVHSAKSMNLMEVMLHLEEEHMVVEFLVKEHLKKLVTFGGGAHGGRIFGKGTLKTDSLDFEDVYFVNELNFNLFSVSQMCDKKNYVLFTNTECLVLSPNFKLPDESQILLKIPRKDNMYSFDMKNIVPKESLTCLVAKATLDESMLWHRRLGHINFKNINKLVKDNLVRGLPTKRFENDQTCVACLKGKQHRASCRDNLNKTAVPRIELNADSPKDMFKLGASHTLEATHVELFSDEDEPKVDLGNITNSYTIEPTSIAKALFDSSWVKAMQEELLQIQAPIGLQVTQKEDGIFISQDKYVAEILKKFNYTDVKSASTPVDLEKPLIPSYIKDIPSLSNKDNFRDSLFELFAYTDSDYAGETQDRKSTTEDENTGGIILSVEFSEELKELLPDEAGK
ncbi:putative ribonuclease H-like domain-containing protein [Tanacetum coccineum]